MKPLNEIKDILRDHRAELIYAVTRGFEILGEAAKPGSPLANDRGDARQAHS